MSTDPPATPPGHVPPIRREILVNADPATAFAVFTERIGQWWPLEDLSVYGPGGTVGFADGQIVEQSASGDAAVWGTVYLWEPAAALAFSWHPGGPPDQATHAEVTFAQADAQTLVTLTHTGWERFADPAEARAEYELGWPVVLGTYRDHVAHHEQDESSLAGAARPSSPAEGGPAVAAPDGAPSRTAARTRTGRRGWPCCTAPAQPLRRGPRCSRTRGSPSTWPSSPGCRTRATWSRPAR